MRFSPGPKSAEGDRMIRRTAVVLAPALAVVLAGCASQSPSPPPDEANAGPLVLTDSRWLRTSPEGNSDVGARKSGANPSVAPETPWLGTIGLRDIVPGVYEMGVGVCVPNPSDSHRTFSGAVDPLRSLGVGVWLKLDF